MCSLLGLVPDLILLERGGSECIGDGREAEGGSVSECARVKFT